MIAEEFAVLPPEIVVAASRGWHILPVRAHGKLPLVKGWPEDATSDIAQLEAWQHQHPACNWGLATGAASGLVVIDVDGAEGRASLADLERQGFTLPATLTVNTGRTDGGEHRYYIPPSGVEIRNDQSGKIGADIDVRGTGGFVVCPPSVHSSGKQYRFIDTSVPVADLPGWVIERLTAKSKKPTPTAETGQVAFEHPYRTPQLTKEIGAMIRRGWSLEIIEETALKINDARNLPPLAQSKVIKTVREMARRYKDQGVGRCPSDSTRGELRPDLICLATVAPRAVDWLWEPYIPARMLTMITGDPGAGKSYLALAVAADLTRGSLLHGSSVAPSDVLYLTAENPTAEVVRPRFELLGGDASRLFVLKSALWTVDGEDRRGSVTLADVSVLDAAISRTQARLVIVDPIQSFLGAGVDLHRSNETRPVLDGLSELAEKHTCAILLLRHLSKQSGGKAIHRGLGSIDLSGAVRSEMLAGSLPDDPEARALIHVKSNVGPYGRTRGYRIDSQGRFSWAGDSAITADELLAAPSSPEDRSARDDAMEWLADLLKSGSKEQKEVCRLADGAKISYATLRRAKDALRVRSFKAGMSGRWLWALPEGAHEVTKGAHTEGMSTFARMNTLEGAQDKSSSTKVLKLNPLIKEGVQKSSVRKDEHLGEHLLTEATIKPVANSQTVKTKAEDLGMSLELIQRTEES